MSFKAEYQKYLDKADLIHKTVAWWENELEKVMARLDELEALNDWDRETAYEFETLAKKMDCLLAKGDAEVKIMENFEKEVKEFLAKRKKKK